MCIGCPGSLGLVAGFDSLGFAVDFGFGSLGLAANFGSLDLAACFVAASDFVAAFDIVVCSFGLVALLEVVGLLHPICTCILLRRHVSLISLHLLIVLMLRLF